MTEKCGWVKVGFALTPSSRVKKWIYEGSGATAFLRNQYGHIKKNDEGIWVATSYTSSGAKRLGSSVSRVGAERLVEKWHKKIYRR